MALIKKQFIVRMRCESLSVSREIRKTGLCENTDYINLADLIRI